MCVCVCVCYVRGYLNHDSERYGALSCSVCPTITGCSGAGAATLDALCRLSLCAYVCVGGEKGGRRERERERRERESGRRHSLMLSVGPSRPGARWICKRIAVRVRERERERERGFVVYMSVFVWAVDDRGISGCMLVFDAPACVLRV